MIEHERLLELLKYNPETGKFRWIKKEQGRSVYRDVGCNRKGYLVIRVDGVLYEAGRLAWFYVKGEWPKLEIDHKDRDPMNNAWDNLREATSSEQKINTRLRSDNTSGIKGVHWSRQNQHWRAVVWKNGKHYQCGGFNTKEEAGEAYAQKVKELFGEFANPAKADV